MPGEPSERPRPALDALESELIARKAAALVRRGLVPRSDREDARQDLAAALLAAQCKVALDPATRHAFARTVLGNAAANLARGRLAAKRHPGRDCPMDPRDAEELGPAAFRDDPADREHLADLAVDLAAALAALPDDLRALADALAGRGVAAAARSLGVPRTTLYAPLATLRGRLRRAGLEQYLPNPPDGSDPDRVFT
ncbi:RNA polymerase sigma factor, sigma-70 family OS=Isosphaera pallida (strain ATCC 43644 / DSM 9630 / IS1B) GN=Isop_2438 PE=4 SV=1 [Gemmataceae bacterium]|nr:RNA polymerase sigma factor, sigma-70 family OS=Isosphaera pallida (strain ATCC 43644 / DSM 9630 / IS1B) GN=Isop_2438 PE=4 SV=1 [Gemmataceae bacterium]VTU02480.1 RNA polymerase sigma factor, sigma-70 family OS=Isosphaera pallida (strain ATCC 43644 / DSM 9630 / IS1B) GN=Isop_2438 PE=4 SV=1 [Gemmataceae bacterium]